MLTLTQYQITSLLTEHAFQLLLGNHKTVLYCTLEYNSRKITHISRDIYPPLHISSIRELIQHGIIFEERKPEDDKYFKYSYARYQKTRREYFILSSLSPKLREFVKITQ